MAGTIVEHEHGHRELAVTKGAGCVVHRSAGQAQLAVLAAKRQSQVLRSERPRFNDRGIKGLLSKRPVWPSSRS